MAAPVSVGRRGRSLARRPAAATYPHIAATDRHLKAMAGAVAQVLTSIRVDAAMIRAHAATSSPGFVAMFAGPVEKKSPTDLLEGALTSAVLDAGASLNFTSGFGGANDDAVVWAKNRSGALISGINAETRKLIADVVAQGQAGQLSPGQIAKQVQGLVGLTPQQAASTQAYRKHLEALAAADKAGKGPAGTAAGKFGLSPWKGGKLDQAKIDKLVDQYAARHLKARAETIARTEMIRAAEAGSRVAWQKAIDAGGANGMILVREWSVTRDDRACPICLKLDGEKVESAVSVPGAPARISAMPRFTGGLQGPPVHPRCRCTILSTLEPAAGGPPITAPLPVEPVEALAVPEVTPPPPAPAVEQTPVNETLVLEYMGQPKAKLQAKLKNTTIVGEERRAIEEALARLKAGQGPAAPAKPAVAAIKVPATPPPTPPAAKPAAKKPAAAPAKKVPAKKVPSKAPAKAPAEKVPAVKPDEMSVSELMRLPKVKLQARLRNTSLTPKERSEVEEALRRMAAGPQPAAAPTRRGWASPDDPTKVTPESVRAVKIHGRIVHKPGDEWSSDKSKASRQAMADQGPSGKLLVDVLKGFQHDSGPASVKNLRRNIDAEIKGESQSVAGQTRARLFLDTLHGVDPEVVPKKLYRGMHIKGTPEQIAARYDEGGSLDLGISSFSDDERVAKQFAGGPRPGESRVYVIVDGKSKGIPVRNFASGPGYAAESEWISAGKYTITKVETDPANHSVTIRMRQETTP